ncbi:MerR family transcriptional regulator [Actinophytocola oryzae]|uniref:MerR family transcriptional regulator n=1 Tax=Actinophytocola oryzae TaxID=502181 RepID=UPI0010627F76|nr:MerR family transcriptional regulator [Actinophytocola oryzae]
MTQNTSYGIGDLSLRTGVPVRTIRFYCDEGVLESVRSAGGHRRFDAGAVDRLTLVRRLRALGLGLPAITDVLTGRRALAEAIAVERARTDAELTALAWRRAALRAVEQADAADRAERLALLSAAHDGRAARDELVAFWRRFFAAPLPPELFHTFVAMNVPEPPADPTPEQVVAYAELVTLTSALAAPFVDRARAHAHLDETALLTAVGAACELVVPLVAAGLRPSPGAELDQFVDAHAAVRGRRDTPEFRRELHAYTAPDRDPRMLRYWTLVGEVSGEATTTGSWHGWLLDALELSLNPA